MINDRSVKARCLLCHAFSNAILSLLIWIQTFIRVNCIPQFESTYMHIRVNWINMHIRVNWINMHIRVNWINMHAHQSQLNQHTCTSESIASPNLNQHTCTYSTQHIAMWFAFVSHSTVYMHVLPTFIHSIIISVSLHIALKLCIMSILFPRLQSWVRHVPHRAVTFKRNALAFDWLREIRPHRMWSRSGGTMEMKWSYLTQGSRWELFWSFMKWQCSVLAHSNNKRVGAQIWGQLQWSPNGGHQLLWSSQGACREPILGSHFG